ncbi:Gfo/Idh/MocA family oxidoreductase [Candidatus Pelagibacter sp.]|nr:Gfo/Idh/MocA family oxidoreductase [Candidatus Pelagibacter sp.]
MSKIALVIGYGSIGKKHAKILKNLKEIDEVVVLSSQQKIPYRKINSLYEIKRLNPFYIVIASRTDKHYGQLKFLEKNFSKKKILVEKPLFEKVYELKIKKNKVYIGYNLRFNPLIIFIKKILKKIDAIFVSAYCGYYLPYWRKYIPYTKSYSSSKIKGGGVILDLSHEIDYIIYIFGKIKILNFIKKKISNLNISSEDFFFLSGTSKKSKIIQISLNYISKKKIRGIKIETNKFGLYGDIINNKLEIVYKNKTEIKKWKDDKNYLNTYKKQHLAIIKNKNKELLCNFAEGFRTFKFLNKLKHLKNKN